MASFGTAFVPLNFYLGFNGDYAILSKKEYYFSFLRFSESDIKYFVRILPLEAQFRNSETFIFDTSFWFQSSHGFLLLLPN